MQYNNKQRILTMSFGGLAMLGLFLLPELAGAGRLESIAGEIAGGSDKKTRQLIVIGMTAALAFPLLVMLYWVTEKKGWRRLVGAVGAVVLGALLYILHFT